MKTTVYVTNRLPQARLGFISLYQKLWNVQPTVSHFRVFGCVCYVFVPDYLRRMFNIKFIHCIFVSYDNQRKGLRCCDPTMRHFYASRNVVSDEASSWWFLQAMALPHSKEVEQKLEQRLKKHSKTNEKESSYEQEPLGESIDGE